MNIRARKTAFGGMAIGLVLVAALAGQMDAKAQQGVDLRRSPAPRAIEAAIETTANRVVLPTGGIGKLDVRRCQACVPVALLAGTASRYFLGPKAVGFEELQTSLATNPRALVVVMYRPDTAELTRLVVSSR